MTKTTKVLSKRLLPLYIASFFHGFVLWYAIEKLFMHQIGFDDAGIGVMVAAYSVMMLLVETPSGILADRWSRKGVLVLASIALALSALIGGVSTEPILYIVSALLWGTFFAFYSGTYDSIVYDTVLEETGKGDEYERYYGRVRATDGIALVAGALAGGAIAELAGIRGAYFWSIPLALVPVAALWWFKEPQLHKAEPLGSIKEHTVDTFKAVLGKRSLLRLLLIIIGLTLLGNLLYEFSQLWLIELDTPTAWYGLIFGAVLSTIGLGGLIAGWAAKRRRQAVLVAFVSMMVSAVGLALWGNLVAVAVLQIILGIGLTLLDVFYMRDLHDRLPSRVRAGAASAVSTVGRLIVIPLALLFGALSAHANIFVAAWLLVGLVGGVVALALWPSKTKRAVNKS